jgi:hypothetical protein
MSRLWAGTLHHLDRLVFRLTKGRHTFANVISGLPVVMLTTTWAKSGKPARKGGHALLTFRAEGPR